MMKEMTELTEHLLRLRNNLVSQNDSFDFFVLAVMSGLDPEESLWDNRHFMSFELYEACLRIIYFYKKES